MYQMINNNISLLLDGINKQDHVAPYVRICSQYNNQESNTAEFKSTYRKFYQLNAAKLSAEFCDSYFELLEEHRNNVELNVEVIVNRLYELESNSKGTHAVHFSFATKLVHTVNNELPVYDSMVAAYRRTYGVIFSFELKSGISSPQKAT